MTRTVGAGVGLSATFGGIGVGCGVGRGVGDGVGAAVGHVSPLLTRSENGALLHGIVVSWHAPSPVTLGFAHQAHVRGAVAADDTHWAQPRYSEQGAPAAGVGAPVIGGVGCEESDDEEDEDDDEDDDDEEEEGV